MKANLSSLVESAMSIFDKHPVLYLPLIVIVGGAIAAFLGYLLKIFQESNIYSSLEKDTLIKLKLYKTVILIFGFLGAIIYLWINYGHDVLKEYKLIQNSNRAEGTITSVDYYDEDVETRTKIGVLRSYYVNYTFDLPSGKIMKGSSEINEDGYYDLTEKFELGLPISIEYSLSDPGLNRVKDFHTEHTTLYEIWRYHLIGGLILFAVSLSFLIYILKTSLSEYWGELKTIGQNKFPRS